MIQKLRSGLSQVRVLRIREVIGLIGKRTGGVGKNLELVGRMITITSRPLGLVTRETTLPEIRVIIVFKEMKTH